MNWSLRDIPKKLSPAFFEYADLLVQLHELMALGDDEDDQGEAIRDAMDSPYNQLTNQERGLLDELSAQLYHLWSGARRRPEPVALAPSDRELKRILEGEDWRRLVLVYPHLRRDGHPEWEFFIKGRLWDWMKVHRAAGWFYHEGAKQADNEMFDATLLLWLFDTGQLVAAGPVAEKLLQRPMLELENYWLALAIYITAALAPGNRKLTARVAGRIRAYWESAPAGVRTLPPKQLDCLKLLLAQVWDSIGRHDESRRFFDDILPREHGDPNFQYFFGLHFILLGKWKEAVEHLALAVRRPSNPLAHLWLSYAELQVGSLGSASRSLRIYKHLAKNSQPAFAVLVAEIEAMLEGNSAARPGERDSKRALVLEMAALPNPDAMIQMNDLLKPREPLPLGRTGTE